MGGSKSTHKELLGIERREIRVADLADWAKELVAAFKKLSDKYSIIVLLY